MKKIPMVLAGVVLTASTLGIRVPNMKALALETESVNVIGENLDTEAMRIERLDPVNGSITFMAGETDSEWWAIRSIVGYRNFEYAVTEVEADEALKTLGEGDDGWMVKLYDKASKGTSSQMQAFINNSREAILGNLPNVLYYAVQYAHRVVQEDGQVTWEDTWWVRGKVSYRSCAHLSIFDGDTMACERVENGDGTISYRPVMANGKPMTVEIPQNEVIKDWDQEWGMVLNDDCTDVMLAMQALKKVLQDGEKTLDANDELLEKVRRNLGTVDSALNLDRRVTSAQAMIDELRKFYVITDTSALETKITTLTSEVNEKSNQIAVLEGEAIEKNNQIAVLEREVEEKTGQIETLESENANLTTEKQQMTEENARLEQRTMELEEKLRLLENNSSKDNNSDGNELLNAEIARLREENERLRNQPAKVVTETETKVIYVTQSEENATASNQEKDKVIETVETTDEDGVDGVEITNKTTDILVPNLGEVEEQQTTGFWWLLIPVIGVLGMAAWWMRRAFFSKR